MFEITVVENFGDGTAQISHFPVADDEINNEIKLFAEMEEKLVAAGRLDNYTILSHYEEWNQTIHYDAPEVLTVTA